MGGTAQSIEAEEDRLRHFRRQEGLLLCGSSCGIDEANSLIRPGKPEAYPEYARDYCSDTQIPMLCGGGQKSPPILQGIVPSSGNYGVAKSSSSRSYSTLNERDRVASDRMMEIDELIVHNKPFDFDAFGTIPHGWVRSLRRPPDAFDDFSGSALVIEPAVQDLIEHEGKAKEMRVLLALPEAHVDMHRAKWLSRRPGFTAEARFLCHICRIQECKAVGKVVFEFAYPRGQPLSELLKDGRPLSIDKAQLLLYRLLALVTTATLEPLRLSGFIHPSMVYLDNEDNLQAVVPLGCLLTFLGVKANLLQVVQAGREWALAPEVKCAVLTQNAWILSEVDMATITDSYAVALLVVRALGQDFFDRNKGVQVDVPDIARDMLVKVLHHESEWRLSGRGALNHPWMLKVANEDCED